MHTFYEAVGYMISAQPNKPQQEKLIAKLMELPNNAVCTLSNYPCLPMADALKVGFADGSSSPEHGRSEQH